MNRREFIKGAAVAAGCAAGLPLTAEALSPPAIENAVATITTTAPIDAIFRTGSFMTIVNANGGHERYNGIYRVTSIDPNRCVFNISHK